MKAKRTGRILATLATFALAMGALVGIQAAQAATGASGIETLLALSLELFHNKSVDLNKLIDYLNQNKISKIVNLAALCGGIRINAENPGKFMYQNL